MLNLLSTMRILMRLLINSMGISWELMYSILGTSLMHVQWHLLDTDGSTVEDFADHRIWSFVEWNPEDVKCCLVRNPNFWRVFDRFIVTKSPESPHSMILYGLPFFPVFLSGFMKWTRILIRHWLHWIHFFAASPCLSRCLGSHTPSFDGIWVSPADKWPQKW